MDETTLEETDRKAPASREALAATVEVGLLVLFLLLWIWIIEPVLGARRWSGFAFFFAFTILSHRRHGDTAADLGIRLDTLARSIGEGLLVITPALLLALAAGIWLEDGVRLDPGRMARSFLWACPWALFQQYGLQAFFARRLLAVVRDPPRHALACGAIFASLHLPNPFLTSVTFGAGYCFSALFRRSPNLFALAAAHALASTVLYHALPASLTYLMRVGPGWLDQAGLR
jgi:hypothetical protein